MGETSIEWTSATWNPLRGCSLVSPGCSSCYAMRIAHRFSAPHERFAGLTRLTKHGPVWTGDVRAVPEKLADPLSWRKPRRVFVNSMSDLFHEDVPNEYIAAVFGVMAATPQHTYQILTKRAGRMREWFDWVATQPLLNFDGSLHESMTTVHPWYICVLHAEQHGASVRGLRSPPYPWPLPNVWLGVSAENQEYADERIPHLLATPTAVRFVSYEPALGPVDFRRHAWLPWIPHAARPPHKPNPNTYLDWIIVGGESGPGARPFNIEWARSVVSQCRGAGVACFVKQVGARPFVGERLDHVEKDLASGSIKARLRVTSFESSTELRLGDPKGGDMAEWPEDLRVRELPEVRT